MWLKFGKAGMFRSIWLKIDGSSKCGKVDGCQERFSPDG